MKPHPNFELCCVLIRMPDGSLTPQDMESQQKLPWYTPLPIINASPGRIKFCVRCYRHLPIAEFIVDGPVRTIIRSSRAGYALPVENINVQCKECR